MAEASALTVFIPGQVAKYMNNLSKALMWLPSQMIIMTLSNCKLEEGRYFTPAEFSHGSNAVIIGAKLVWSSLMGMVKAKKLGFWAAISGGWCIGQQGNSH